MAPTWLALTIVAAAAAGASALALMPLLNTFLLSAISIENASILVAANSFKKPMMPSLWTPTTHAG